MAINRDDYLSVTDYVNFRSRKAGHIPCAKARLEQARAHVTELQNKQIKTIEAVLDRYFEKIVTLLQIADKSLCVYGTSGRPHVVDGWHDVGRARIEANRTRDDTVLMVTHCSAHSHRVSRFMTDGAIAVTEDRNQAWARMLRCSYERPELFDAAGIYFGGSNLALVLRSVDPDFPTTAQDLLDRLVLTDGAISQEIEGSATKASV